MLGIKKKANTKYTIKENFMALKGNKSDLHQGKIEIVFFKFYNISKMKR